MTPRTKGWLRGALVAGGLLLLFLLLGGRKRSPLPEVEVLRVAMRDLVETVPASGKLRPVTESAVSPDVSGEIVELNFREGDPVHKGDILVKIKQDLYLSLVEKAEAALGSLRAEFSRQQAAARQATAALSRARSLYAQHAISASELEAAQAEADMMAGQLTAARWNVRSGEASLKEARENLTKTVIRAPMEGTVSRLSVALGERVVGTSQMAGTELLRIADFSRMEVVTEVGENDVVRIAPGDSATLSLDAYPRLTFSGLVTQIANSSKFVAAGIGQVANFEVRIAVRPASYQRLLQEDPTPLKPGMSATVSIVTRERMDVLAIPLQSVFLRDRREAVWIVDETGTVTAREIETGIQNLTSIEVCSGLAIGEAIVTAPYQAINGELSDGCKVRIRNP